MTTVDTTVSTRRRRLRRKFAAVLVVAAGLALMGGLYSAFAPQGSAATNTDPALQQGRSLFLQGCASCHGLDAQGTKKAPSLIGVGAAAVDFRVGTGRMPLKAYGAEAAQHHVQYTDNEIQLMAAYVGNLAPGPAIPTDLHYQAADTAFGGVLFRTNCAQCHNAAGSGGALTYGKYAPSLSTATPTQIYEAMISGPENMPVFGNSQITPAQKLAIIKYITSIRKEANPGGVGLGRVGPVSETVMIWFVGIVVLVGFTLWIGARA